LPLAILALTYAYNWSEWVVVLRVVATVNCNSPSVVGNQEQSAIIFNPNTVQFLERGLLVTDHEFIAVKTGSNEYTLNRHGSEVE
jgi:hypothetical protein